jgi:acyl dehydratase
MLHLEDFSIGGKFAAGPIAVTAAEIKGFAAAFDPQPFHVDEVAAEATPFAGLAASGWHTGAMTMRLLVEALPIAGGVIGGGVDELRWLRPVRPGDALRVESEVLEVRVSASRPTQGWVRMRNTTYNQEDQPVQSFVANLVVPRRDLP